MLPLGQVTSESCMQHYHKFTSVLHNFCSKNKTFRLFYELMIAEWSLKTMKKN